MTDQPIIIARAFHGTSRAAAEAILREGFRPSANRYDWLGHGIYFWQDAPRRARAWAADRYGAANAAVIGAEIELDGALDLLDIGWEGIIGDAYQLLAAELASAGRRLPQQRGGAHHLDCAVIDWTVGLLNVDDTKIAVVRAAFAEGEPLYLQSALFSLAHVQIAVRDARVLKRLWLES